MYIPEKNPAATFCRIMSLGNTFSFFSQNTFCSIQFRKIIINEIKIEIKLGSVSGLFNVENLNLFTWCKLLLLSKNV